MTAVTERQWVDYLTDLAEKPEPSQQLVDVILAELAPTWPVERREESWYWLVIYTREIALADDEDDRDRLLANRSTIVDGLMRAATP